MDNEKLHELVNDVVGVSKYISNCCSEKVYSPTGEWGICMMCKEHCDVIDTDE